jgi:hypothetical protein
VGARVAAFITLVLALLFTAVTTAKGTLPRSWLQGAPCVHRHEASWRNPASPGTDVALSTTGDAVRPDDLEGERWVALGALPALRDSLRAAPGRVHDQEETRLESLAEHGSCVRTDLTTKGADMSKDMDEIFELHDSEGVVVKRGSIIKVRSHIAELERSRDHARLVQNERENAVRRAERHFDSALNEAERTNDNVGAFIDKFTSTFGTRDMSAFHAASRSLDGASKVRTRAFKRLLSAKENLDAVAP